jgi:transcriptional regulator with XRE-family HTH domain
MLEPRPHALNALVRRRLAELHLSYAEAARRGDLPKATVANLATQPLRQVPRADTLLGLARAINVPLVTIQETVAECVGLVYAPRDAEGTTRALVDTVQQLSPARQREIAALAEAMLRNEGGGDQGVDVHHP